MPDRASARAVRASPPAGCAATASPPPVPPSSSRMGRSMANAKDPGGPLELAGMASAAGQAGVQAGQDESAVTVFRREVEAALGPGSERWPGCGPDCVLGCGGTGQSQMFLGVPGQVRAVRDFVRLALAGHPAADDAVAVASELAANSVAHSGSGSSGGMFTVHVTALSAASAGLAVTELRGDDYPAMQEAGPDVESGRGLAVVRSLTSLFWVSDADKIRTLLATIPAPSRGVDSAEAVPDVAVLEGIEIGRAGQFPAICLAAAKPCDLPRLSAADPSEPPCRAAHGLLRSRRRGSSGS